MAFRVGQKVVCVDASCSPRGTVVRGYRVSGEMHGLAKGLIYTVRGFGVAWSTEEQAIFLDEIVRPNSGPDRTETPYRASRFRPVKETDISIFTAMLAPNPKQRVRIEG